MINRLQRNIFFTISAGLIILTVLWLPDLLAPAANYAQVDTQPLKGWLLPTKWMSGTSGLWINLGLTVVTAVFLYLSNLRHLFVNANHRLMLLLYLTLASALPASLYYPEAQVAAIAVVAGLYCLFQAYQRKTALAQLFLSAMWISIAGLYYFPSVAVLFVVVVSTLSARQFNWRDWTAFLAGLLCPYFYCGLYFFWTENSIIPLWQRLQENFQPIALPIIAHNLYEYIFVIILGIIIVWVYLTQNIEGALNKIKVVHLRHANNWLLFFVLISAIILRPPYGSIMPLLAIPLSIILANADNQLWRKKVYIFFLLLLFTAIIGSRIT